MMLSSFCFSLFLPVFPPPSQLLLTTAFSCQKELSKPQKLREGNQGLLTVLQGMCL